MVHDRIFLEARLRVLHKRKLGLIQKSAVHYPDPFNVLTCEAFMIQCPTSVGLKLCAIVWLGTPIVGAVRLLEAKIHDGNNMCRPCFVNE